MEKISWEKLTAVFEAREQREKVVILAALAGVIVYLWLILIFDPASEKQTTIQRQITITESQIVEESKRYQTVQSSYTNDPDMSNRLELKNLQDATLETDRQLSALYEQLILPRKMAEVLTSILQRETSLELVGVENLKPESLIISNANAAVPLVGATTPGVITGEDVEAGVEVFKHGLILHLKGEYLEVVRYLQSLETLDVEFFWDELDFEIGEFSEGNVSLNIFTLSTNRGWIGV